MTSCHCAVIYSINSYIVYIMQLKVVIVGCVKTLLQAFGLSRTILAFLPPKMINHQLVYFIAVKLTTDSKLNF